MFSGTQFLIYFWLDSDLDVEALREESLRLLAICSCRFSFASLKKERGEKVPRISTKRCFCDKKTQLHSVKSFLDILTWGMGTETLAPHPLSSSTSWTATVFQHQGASTCGGGSFLHRVANGKGGEEVTKSNCLHPLQEPLTQLLTMVSRGLKAILFYK